MKDNSQYHVIIIAGGKGTRISNLTKEIPKPFLKVNGKRIIEYTLDYLDERGFKEVSLSVGHMKEAFMEAFGNKYKNLDIDYVIDNDLVGHGWGLFTTKERWEKRKKPVFFIEGDIYYDPAILDKVIDSEKESVIIVDNLYNIETGDEEVVTGKDEIIGGFKREDHKNDESIVGELIGINKLSADIIGKIYTYMEGYFDRIGKEGQKYEMVLNSFIKDTNEKIYYIKSNGLKWVNINDENDYKKAHETKFDNK